jgi:hypothetical protein
MNSFFKKQNKIQPLDFMLGAFVAFCWVFVVVSGV